MVSCGSRHSGTHRTPGKQKKTKKTLFKRSAHSAVPSRQQASRKAGVGGEGQGGGCGGGGEREKEKMAEADEEEEKGKEEETEEVEEEEEAV